MTCRLQEVRPRAPCPLAAPMAQVIALTAPAALALFGVSFHEPFHADGRQRPMAVTDRSGQNPPRRRRNSHALTAPMAPVIALMALAALELSGEPVHARGLVSYSRLLLVTKLRAVTRAGRPSTRLSRAPWGGA